MAGCGDDKGGNDGEGGTQGEKQEEKGRNEEEKKRRGRPSKKISKREEKEAGGLKKFLETGKMWEEKGLVKGRELERTPIKKIESMEDKVGGGAGIGGQQVSGEGGGEASKGNEEDQADQATGEAGIGAEEWDKKREERTNGSKVRESEEWKIMNERIRELESRLENALKNIVLNKKEIGLGKKINCLKWE